ncbi:TonB-dependent siderophore receptor [Pseudoxanthomonas winnipegensis]|jgi:ferric enterobactin receptor|uniref:TonB-dependent siderophore receptor n=1 Tax=Pseudoxanthomonas winnipegensis TaxID=2480810 RepID=A0ABY1WE19_9GAMM|nr:TonB-dependent siderophore receptor [Pseudoxanthomonas winnipegensis]TAA12018.1 TonB-dependent siderophore receptor [Pseudoxanthomonas winnipegensis]TAA19619.1 TonB-dependent siderophore receptor [Pseudoxanthomonas winnipegensis]TAH70965.1 TonB-dependent siderophore receptor [Pseudoxanthomonas winnipegensis]
MTPAARRTLRAPVSRPLRLALLAALASSLPAQAQQAETDQDADTTLDTLHVTAEQIAKQALGTSIITREDIERRPPANDLSDLLRTMPGVNLTGNSASGAYGNNRQIDLRGMGPENTLILIDGRRVSARDSVRMGVAGERNSRGDTNWVPAEAVERIEVLRGPAAARYGSGAAGGVVNIITKRPTGDLSGSMTLYGLVPEHSDEGGSQRAGFTLSGPLARDLSFRLYGNLNKTDADAPDINSAHSQSGVAAAGREGVRNKDINGLLRWDASDAQVVEVESGYSRQGNIFAGEYLNNSNATVVSKVGDETNVMTRRDAALTHRGKWDFGTSRLTVSYAQTDNDRIAEGLAGGPEGSLSTTPVWTRSTLRDVAADGEINLPTLLGGVDNIWTVGFEYRKSRLDDPYSVSQTAPGVVGIDPSGRNGKTDEQVSAVFVEDNLYATERLTLTPGLRFDHHSAFGNELSPSLNVQYRLAPDWLIKGGVARAFKAPNLYQANPNYLYYTRGNGCPSYYVGVGTGGCYIQGSADLDPETSINKELGIEWLPDTGYHASLTYFHNDYDNKIVAGYSDYYQTPGRAFVYQWVNASKALVQGVEGNLKLPLLGDRGRTLSWDTNLTWMIDNKNEATGQPLSVIPKYTLNSTLDWRATQRLSFALMATFYGKQEQARLDRNNEAICGAAGLPVCDSLGAYPLWSTSLRYRITRDVSLGLGVNNLADKRIFREGSRASSAGAQTYNEPGRAYWASLRFGF